MDARKNRLREGRLLTIAGDSCYARCASRNSRCIAVPAGRTCGGRLKTRGFLGFVGASFLLLAAGSVLSISAYAGTGSPPPPPPPPPTTSAPPPPTTTTPPPKTTSPPPTTSSSPPTTTTTQTQPSSGSSSSGSTAPVHHKVKQHTQTTHRKKHPANTTPQTPKPDRTVKPKAIVPVSNTSDSGVPQIAAVAAIVAAILVVLALLAVVISVALMRTRGPREAGGGNIMIR